MAKKSKKNLYDVIIFLIRMIYSRVESKIGKVNITGGLLIALLACLSIVQPIVFYILQMFQFLLNSLLDFFEKDLIPLNESSNTWLVLLISLAFLTAESIFCSWMIYWSDSKKKELENKDK